MSSWAHMKTQNKIMLLVDSAPPTAFGFVTEATQLYGKHLLRVGTIVSTNF